MFDDAALAAMNQSVAETRNVAVAQPNVDELLGARIRHMRRARSMSLKDVAGRANLSVSFISQIERGTSSGSVRVLTSIANALDVGLSSLFENEEATTSTKPSGMVQRKNGRRQLSFGRTGISKELVTPAIPNSRLDIYLITIEPGGTTGSDPYAHAGEEAGTVVQGSLELTVDGLIHLLQEGDGFVFSSRTPHQFSNPGSKLTQVLWVNARMPDI